MHADIQEFLSALQTKSVLGASPVGLELQRSVDQEDFTQILGVVAASARKYSVGRSVLLAWMGDLMVAGDREPSGSPRIQGSIAELARASGFTAGALRNSKLVCTRIPSWHLIGLARSERSDPRRASHSGV